MHIIQNNKSIQLNKIEQYFIKKYKITEVSNRNNDNKIAIKKVIASAQLNLKKTKIYKNFQFII